MRVYDDSGVELIQCHCDNGRWFTECCNGAGGCSCHGQPVDMGTCHICHGTGWRRPDADIKANLRTIQGFCFAGSGPSSGYWADKPAMGR